MKEGTGDYKINFNHAYGIYLMNGGRKEDFENLTPFDIDLIRVTHTAERERVLEFMNELWGAGEDG